MSTKSAERHSARAAAQQRAGRRAGLTARLAVPCLAVMAADGFGCQLAAAPPMSGLDPAVYVLVGEVRARVGPVTSSQVVGAAWGIAVDVTEAAAAPGAVPRRVEVFEFDLSPACEPVGHSEAAVMSRFRVGDEVRIVARATSRLASAGGSGPRLEAGPFDRPATLALRHRDEPPLAVLMTTGGLDGLDPERYDWRWYAGRITFEIAAELARLERAGDDRARAEILGRLARLRPAYPGQIDFAATVRAHIDDPRLAERLLGQGP